MQEVDGLHAELLEVLPVYALYIQLGSVCMYVYALYIQLGIYVCICSIRSSIRVCVYVRIYMYIYVYMYIQYVRIYAYAYMYNSVIMGVKALPAVPPITRGNHATP